MKTLLIILASVMLSSGAIAQRKSFYHYPVYHPRFYVSPFSYSFGPYPLYGYPYYGYRYGYGYPYYGAPRMPYRLSLEIQSIKDDYRSQIRETRKNKSLSRSQRRQEIRSLKAERDQEIINAQKNFIRRGSFKNQHHDDGT